MKNIESVRLEVRDFPVPEVDTIEGFEKFDLMEEFNKELYNITLVQAACMGKTFTGAIENGQFTEVVMFESVGDIEPRRSIYWAETMEFLFRFGHLRMDEANKLVFDVVIPEEWAAANVMRGSRNNAGSTVKASPILIAI